MDDLYSNDTLSFSRLPSYASFIIDQKLDEYVKEQIQLSRALQLPILKYFENMNEEDLVAYSKISSEEWLTYFKQNRALILIEDSIKQWIANQLPQNIERHQLSADDITLISYIRKRSLIKFIADYTKDITEALEIVNEIDRFIVKSDALAFETFRNLMDERINEQLHFIEKIADTSPGIVYVYDVLEDHVIYSNKKTKHILGYDETDFGKNAEKAWSTLSHPDDAAAVSENLKEVAKLKDGEVRVFEHRIKSKENDYLWMREYQSVFKRNDQGVVSQVIGLTMNIVAEKQIAEQLVKREEQLLEAQALAEMGSFSWNLINDESESTPQLTKILGLKPASKLKDFMQHIHPYDRKQVEKALDEALKVTGNYDSEFRFFAEDNAAEKILWSRGVVAYDDDGQPVSMKGTVMDVTERHHMIQKLKRSEELYKQAQALTHIGNWTWDIPRNKITWTDELYRIFGMEPQSVDIKLDQLADYLHPKDKEQFIASVRQIQNAKPEDEYFARIILKDDSIKILNIKAEVIADDDGVVYKVIGTAQDITQQKTNERKLRENQNFIQKITDATPSIIAAYNIHTGKYTFVNRAFEKILGYPVSEVLESGASFLTDLIHPDDLPTISEENRKALEIANANPSTLTNEPVVNFKYRMRNSEGEYRWFHTFGTIFDRNEKKQVEHVLNISIDITDRIAAEEKVIEQEHFIQHIADASPTVLYLFDIEKDSIVYINQEIEPVLGFSSQEIIQLGPDVKSVLFHPDDVGNIGQHVKQQMLGEAFREYECRMREKNGGWRTLLVREIGFKQNAEGEFTQFLCAALDITDRKQIEETLYQKTTELQQSNASLEEFAYVASHDLKEPLRKITTFGDRLVVKEKDRLPEESFKYLEKIIEASQRMQRMIDDLLSISMISVEKTFEKADLQVILNEVLQTLEFKIEESNAVINTDILPVANIIPSQFRQLFQNLVSNSLKFSRADVKPVITIKHKYLRPSEADKLNLSSAVKHLQISVTDNGIGFDEKYSEKIFAIFHRLHGRSEYEGTGIGLAICKKIVENHGGKIFATGKENEGANFTIIIPT